MDASGSGCLLFMGLHRAVFTWYRGRVEYFPTSLITEKALARDQVCPVDVTTDVHNLARGKIAMQPRRREHQKFCAPSHAAHVINSTARWILDYSHTNFNARWSVWSISVTLILRQTDILAWVSALISFIGISFRRYQNCMYYFVPTSEVKEAGNSRRLWNFMSKRAFVSWCIYKQYFIHTTYI